MVFLRNVFVQTCNTNNSFFNFFSGFTYSLSAYFNNENNEELTNCNAENTLGNTNNRQIKSMYIKNTSFIFSYQKYICSFINLHINSLTHIRENDKTDYSGHQDFVHALELEEEDEWSLDDIKTVVSVNFDT